MLTNTELLRRIQVRTAQVIQEECCLFCQGVVESFGVEWKVMKKDGEPVVQDPSKTKRNSSTSPSSSSSPPVAPRFPSETDKTRTNSSQPVDNVAHLSSVTASITSTLTDTEVPCTSSWHFPPPVRFELMPPWKLVEYDPKLWVLLRKNLLANLALTALTLTYMALSHCVDTTSASSLRATSSSSWNPSAPNVRGTSASRSFLGRIFLFWLRLSLWTLKYMGQWPFYTVLQVIGLVWYSQLYRETWLVRKGWVLRATRLREAAPLTRKTKTTTPQTSALSVLLPPLAEGVTRPWLSSIPLNVLSEVDEAMLASTTTTTTVTALHPIWCQASLLLHASVAYSKHATHLVWRILLHKGPTTPLQEWVLGDAAAVARLTAAAPSSQSASSFQQAPLTSLDIFDTITCHLESTSEVIFKALATISFAFFASCVERLPFLGMPLCLLLNAQLYAFYVFDYRYATQQPPDGRTQLRGFTLSYQLRHFEQCWVYYAGYGIGSAIVSLWLTRRVGTIVSVCAMSILYSWHVVWSGFAVPLPSSRPLPVFSLWFDAVDMIQKQYAILWRSVVIITLLYIPYQCLCYV